MTEPSTICAACGRPGHRYGRNEGMDRFDPQACINLLLAENQALRDAIRDHIFGDHPLPSLDVFIDDTLKRRNEERAQ